MPDKHGVRECRGHWHVTTADGEHDLAGYCKDEAAARELAAEYDAEDSAPDAPAARRDERVDEIAARCKAATAAAWRVAEEPNPLNDVGRATFPNGVVEEPERWIVTEWDHPQLEGPECIVTLGHSPFLKKAVALRINPADAEFIAHARSDIPWLLERLAAAEARAVRAEGERDEFKMHRDTDYAAYQEHLDNAAKDSARLDWVQSHRGCVGHHLDTNRWYSRAGCKFATVREAIDAAIAAERP